MVRDLQAQRRAMARQHKNEVRPDLSDHSQLAWIRPLADLLRQEQSSAGEPQSLTLHE